MNIPEAYPDPKPDISLHHRLIEWGIMDPVALVESCIAKGYIRRSQKAVGIPKADRVQQDIAMNLSQR